VTRTDDLDAIIKDEEPDGRADEVVAMDEGIDQQLLEDGDGNLWCPKGIDPFPRLELAEVSGDEG
jgi:hypothetical protein